MKKMLFALLLLIFLPFTAQSATVGPGFSLAWDCDGCVVDGYRLYVNGQQEWEGTELSAFHEAAGITISGEYTVYVTAYNAAGESGPSSSLTFSYAATAPESPTNMRIETPR